MADATILITGDSFVEGVGATGHEGPHGWAQQFAARYFPNGKAVVIGIGGHTSRDLLHRIDAELMHRPDRVMIGIGTNDSRWRPSLGQCEVPLAEFENNLTAIADRIAAAGADLILLGLTRVDEGRTTPFKDDKVYRNDLMESYDTALAAAAKRHGATFVELPALAHHPGALADGLHPSDEGHRLILNAVARVVGQH